MSESPDELRLVDRLALEKQLIRQVTKYLEAPSFTHGWPLVELELGHTQSQCVRGGDRG